MGESVQIEVRPQRTTASANTLATSNFGAEQPSSLIQEDHWGSRFTLGFERKTRGIWNLIFLACLIYTGTVFLYTLTFLELHFPDPHRMQTGLKVIEIILDVLFWFDLVLNFFLTYEDSRGVEIDSLRLIAASYLRFWFWLNLIACLPDVVFKELLSSFTDSNAGSSALRILRLQRIVKMVRLIRMLRLFRFPTIKPLPDWFYRAKGVRAINHTTALLWFIHILACGWYICASLHEDPAETWVARRPVNAAGDESLIDAGPFDQWCHAMYFVLTVFTTVGFGDMSALTVGEIFYVSFTMLIGVVVHSIIIGEVISLVTSMDETAEFEKAEGDVIRAFAKHAEVSPKVTTMLTMWVKRQAEGMVQNRFDKVEMKRLILGSNMSRNILNELPQELHGGLFLRQDLLLTKNALLCLSPRLPILIALSGTRDDYKASQIVYQKHDYALGISLVVRGTFCHVGSPVPTGGRDEASMPAIGVDAKDTTFLQRRISVQSVANVKRGESAEVDTRNLFPYFLNPVHTTIGLQEMLQHPHNRNSTVRCESQEGGQLLSISKQDMLDIMTEFPQWGCDWARRSALMEGRRIRALAKLTTGRPFAQARRIAPGMDHKVLAAMIVQRNYRKKTRGDVNDEPSSQRLRATKAVARTLDTAAASTTPAPTLQQAGQSDAIKQLVQMNRAQANEIQELRQSIGSLKVEILSAIKDKREDFRFDTRGNSRSYL